MTDGSSTTPLTARREWLVPALLILLSAVPVAAGAVRLTELGTGAAVTPHNARFFAAPLPVVLHVISVSVFALLGAFQFSRSLRGRNPGWHRLVGRVVAPSGMVAASTGLWMQLTYQLPEHDGELLAVFRLLFGSVMLLSLSFGVVAVLRRDFARHEAWMLRGYAIGLGAGTQFVLHVPWLLFLGFPGRLPRALLMGAGWVINLLIAECILRKRSTARPFQATAEGLTPKCLRNADANLLGLE